MKHGVKTDLTAACKAASGLIGNLPWVYRKIRKVCFQQSAFPVCILLERIHMIFRSMLCTAALLASAVAMAHDYRAGDIHVEHPYARATVPGQTSGAAYLTLENTGKRGDALISADSPAASAVEIHTMSMDGNVMRMREIASVELKPAAKLTMRPGEGYHLMLTGLKAPLHAGDKIALTLRFKHAGKIETALTVEDGMAKNTSAGKMEQIHR